MLRHIVGRKHLLCTTTQRARLFGASATILQRRQLSTSSTCLASSRGPLAGAGVSVKDFTERYATELYDAKQHSCAISGAEHARRNAEGEELVMIRGRVERIRGRGKLAFLYLRQPPFSAIQVVCSGKELATQARKELTPESIVEVTGVLRRADSPVTSTTCSQYELHAESFHVLSTAAVPLPFPVRDENTKLDTRLNHRVIDLRTPLSAAVMRVVSQICQSFRERLLAMDFLEIHTPKLVPSASEGGSSVFKVDYFGEQQSAYLAQSPQLYKQMVLMGDAMRVFEIGPVFRAENSLTHRHLTEFVGLDAEMVIKESYLEVLDVLEHVLCGVLADLQDPSSPASAAVGTAQEALQLQAEALASAKDTSEATAATEASPPLLSSPVTAKSIAFEVPLEMVAKYGLGNDTAQTKASNDPYMARIGGGTGLSSNPRVLRMDFDSAARLLRDYCETTAEVVMDDLSLPQERNLGAHIKARYGVDVYIIDQFPVSARPFYTMSLSCTASGNGRDAKPQSTRTRSYDMYLRGEEICSGAQRVHDVTLLLHQMREKGVNPASVKDYVDSFRYGAWPHAGFGLGLERIALFFLGASDIRQISLFPRDPKRISP